MRDLFNHIEELPEEVQSIILKYAEEDEIYQNCNKLKTSSF